MPAQPREARTPPRERPTMGVSTTTIAKLADTTTIAKLADRPTMEVSMRATELQSMIDSARRAKLAAKQAMRICEAAAKAFKSEVDVLDTCQSAMESKLL